MVANPEICDGMCSLSKRSLSCLTALKTSVLCILEVYADLFFLSEASELRIWSLRSCELDEAIWVHDWVRFWNGTQ